MSGCRTLVSLALIAILSGSGGAQESETLTSTPRPTAEAYRLLFNSVVTPEGLLVVSIQQDSPVLNMFSAEETGLKGLMELGDIVAAVDGQPIRTMNDYHQVMAASGARNGRVEVTVLDRATRRPHRWLADARKILVPVEGQPGSSLRKAHFLLVGLTNDVKIGQAMDDTVRQWERMVEAVDAERRGNIHILRGDDCQTARILSRVKAMEVAARDTLFCVYCGHGAFDPARSSPDDLSKGHHFQIRPTGDLMRKTLTDELLSKGARLTVLMTDTCNIEDVARPAVPMVEETRTVLVMGFLPFEQLLFNYRGVVDISGTDFGQFGFCQPGYGSWFSVSAIPVLQYHSDWRDALTQLTRVVDNDFQQRRSAHGILQAHMTPRAFRFDVHRDEAVVALAADEPPRQKEVSLSVRRPASP